MYNLEEDATNRMVNLGVELMSSGFRVGGELAKEILLVSLEKVKESRENKTGLISLKALLKSKEELNIVNLNKEHLDYFKEQAKNMMIAYSSVTSKDADVAKIIYKTKDINLIKNIMSEILDRSKSEQVVDTTEEKVFGMLNRIDFKTKDENAFRYEIRSIKKEKALAIKDLLLINGIKNDVVINKIDKNDNLSLDYKIDKSHKKKAIEIIDSCKNISVEDIAKKINEKSNNKQQIKDDKVPLQEQIKQVEKRLTESVTRDKDSKNKSKSKKKEQDR